MREEREREEEEAEEEVKVDGWRQLKAGSESYDAAWWFPTTREGV